MRKRKATALVAGILAVLLLVMLPANLAEALSSSEIQEQIDELEKENDALQKELDRLEAEMTAHTQQLQDMIRRKDTMDQQIAVLHSQIRNVSELISACSLKLAQKQTDYDRAEAKLEEMNDAFKARIRAMEEQGSISYWSVIFQANSFADLLDRLQMVAEIAGADQRRLQQLRQAAEEVEAARNAMAEEKAALDQSRLELEQSRKALEEKRAEVELLLAEMTAKGQEFEGYIEEAEEKQEQLMQDLLDAEEAYDKAKYEEWLATSKPGESKPVTEGNEVDGRIWYTPTKNYRISSKYGWRIHPIHGTRKMHNGVDMAAPQGTPIYATRSGVVTVASFEAGGAGYYVKINHGDGYQSIYMHMTHYIVKKGDHVSAGQIIGYVGSTGGSTGPHLHFGISKYSSKNGTWSYVDPLDYIKV